MHDVLLKSNGSNLFQDSGFNKPYLSNNVEIYLCIYIVY